MGCFISDFFCLHLHFAMGFAHSGQVRPDSVEYTNRLFFMISDLRASMNRNAYFVVNPHYNKTQIIIAHMSVLRPRCLVFCNRSPGKNIRQDNPAKSCGIILSKTAERLRFRTRSLRCPTCAAGCMEYPVLISRFQLHLVPIFLLICQILKRW